MAKKVIHTLLFVFLTMAVHIAFAAPAEKEIKDKVCPNGDCRGETKVFLKVKDGPAFEKVFPYLPPIAQNGMVTILAGETVYIEADISNQKLTSLVSVSKIIHPEKTISFSFRQDPKIGGGLAMVLTVHNPFQKVLRYDLKMMTLDGIISKTSCCPVMAGKDVIEMWPHPIFQLIVENFRFIKDGSKEAMECH